MSEAGLDTGARLIAQLPTLDEVQRELDEWRTREYMRRVVRTFALGDVARARVREAARGLRLEVDTEDSPPATFPVHAYLNADDAERDALRPAALRGLLASGVLAGDAAHITRLYLSDDDAHTRLEGLLKSELRQLHTNTQGRWIDLRATTRLRLLTEGVAEELTPLD